MPRPLIACCVFVLLTLSQTTVGAKSGQGQDAPSFSLEVLQGPDSGNSIQLRGKVVVLEFWATYCGWCKKTHPQLAAFKKANPDVVILAISAQNKNRLQRYLRKNRTGLTVLHDKDSKTSQAYRAGATPTFVLIDQHSKVQAWAQGADKLGLILSSARELL